MSAYGKPGLACSVCRQAKGRIIKLHGFTVTLCEQCERDQFRTAEALKRAQVKP